MAPRSRLRPLATGLATALLALALIPSWAGADADPASDYLLIAPVFYPYQPPTSPALKRALEGALAQLKARGLALKVAILDDPTDLGGVTNLWSMPQKYADFLDMEISFNTHQPLLVVMPAGFGASHAGPQGELNGMLVDAAHGADGLARSAIAGVVRLAQASGKPIPAPAIPATAASPAKSGGGTSPLLTFGAPVALVLLAAIVAATMRRRSSEDEEPGSEAGVER